MNTQTKYTLAFTGKIASIAILFTCSYVIANSLTEKSDRQIAAEQFEMCQSDPTTTICI